MSYDPSHLTRLLRRAEAAAEAAGKILFTHGSRFEILRSEGKDLKSAADLSAEKAIFELLDPEGLAVLSEETRADAEAILEEYCWIVDPLDGTLNYTRGLPLFCVSIALWEKGQPLLGVIHDPVNAVTYSGIVGQGATVCAQPLSVSETGSVGQAILCTGFPSGRSYDTKSLTQFVTGVQEFKKIRLLGSAALSLAYLAAGHVDAYCEEDIWLWDVAAGLAIVRAAGGTVSFGPWNHQLKSRVYATNGNANINRLLSGSAATGEATTT